MTPIFFLLLPLLLLSTSTTTTADVVLDIKGNPVVPGSYYYAVPVSPVITKLIGGGLTMFNNGSASCPTFFVAQSSIRGPLDYGIPLKFTPIVTTSENTVSTSVRLNIAFKYLDPQPLCRRRYSTVWAMTSEKLVVLDGVEGSDASWFTLEYGYDFDGASYYSFAFEDKMLFSERKANGEILLGLRGGLPPFVTFVKEEDRAMSM